MVRTIIDCPIVPSDKNSWKGYEQLEISIQVVTPMFGGGVEAGVFDPVTLIRVPSIRGHLRFWWRATRGAACETAEKLKQREVEIWGDTENPSKVIVEVKDVKTETPRPCGKYKWNQRKKRGRGGYDLEWDAIFRNSLTYALFPFQGKPPKESELEPEEPPKQFVPSAAFKVRVTYPKNCADELRSALTAWLNFGGIGARARRGCGSLFCSDFAPSNSRALDSLFKTLFCQTSRATGRSVSAPEFILYNQTEVPTQNAWEQAMDLLREFRQGPSEGRKGQCGPSLWPEADAVRRLTGYQAKGNGPDKAFPRAAFGLPIIFHFQPGKGEPPDTELYPILSDRDSCGRMASPLIIKPLVLQSGKAFSIIMMSRTPLPDRLGLRETKSHKERLPEGVNASAIVNPAFVNTVLPMGRSGSRSGSAIEAFMAFAKKQGFQEVTL